MPSVAKLDDPLALVREKLQQADHRVHELNADLRARRDKQPRVSALTSLKDSLKELKKVGGEDPLFGEKLKKDSYKELLERIDQESEEHISAVAKLKEELKKASAKVSTAMQDYDRLAKKQEERDRKRRRAALEAYRREVAEKGFQPRKDDVFYRPMGLPWGGQTEDDRRLRRISSLILLFTLLLSIGITMIILPQVETEEIELPARLAKLLMERQKNLEPTEAPREQRIEKRKLQARKKAPETKTRKQQQARAKARKSGLLALGDTFESLKKSQFEDKLRGQTSMTVAGRKSSESERKIILASAGQGSGGITISKLSRATGGSGLVGRNTSRVSSGLADSVAANADRRVVGSGKASRTDEEIQIVFDKNKSALYRLYNRELRRDPSLQGKVVLKLTIAPSGRVTMCIVLSSNLKAKRLERKIAQRVKLFDFGQKDVSAVTITYPIDFLPA